MGMLLKLLPALPFLLAFMAVWALIEGVWRLLGAPALPYGIVTQLPSLMVWGAYALYYRHRKRRGLSVVPDQFVSTLEAHGAAPATGDRLHLLRVFVYLAVPWGWLWFVWRRSALVRGLVSKHLTPANLQVAVAGLSTAGGGATATVAAPPRPAPTRIGTGSHGSATFGGGHEMATGQGLIVGRTAPGVRQPGSFLRFNQVGNLTTIAPSRSGKGISTVVPNLLTYPGSIIVTDPKGENAAITARARKEMGQQVAIIDPFGMVGGTDGFNPLDLLDLSRPSVVDDARLLAEALVIRDGRNPSAAHFDDLAAILIRGVALHVKATAPAEKCHLAYIRHRLTCTESELDELLTELENSDTPGVRDAAVAIRRAGDRERGSILTTMQRHLDWLGGAHVLPSVARSTFDLEDLKRGTLSLYLVLPPDMLDTYNRLLRSVIGAALSTMYRQRGMPRHPVLFMLDEFPALGRFEPVLKAITVATGYGACFWVFAQDLSQLEEHYGDRALTFLSADVLQVFGLSDLETCKHVSDKLGETTIKVRSDTQNTGRNRQDLSILGGKQTGQGVSVSETARKLLTPDEILRMPSDRQLVIRKGMDPVLAAKINYLVDQEFQGQYDDNPMWQELN